MEERQKVGIVYAATASLFVLGSLLLSFTRLGDMLDMLPRLFVSQALVAAPGAVYLWLNRKQCTVAEQLRFHKIRPVNVVLLVLLTYCILPLMAVINSVSLQFTDNAVSGMMTSVTGNYPLFAGVIGIALVPCILEESVYRGIFFNTFRKINVRRGILLSGLLFGLMHMNLNQFCYAFAMGCIFAIVIEATDSILSTMIMHFVLNANSTILLYVLTKLEAYMKNHQDEFSQIMGDTDTSEILGQATEQMNDASVLAGVTVVWAVIAIVPTILAVVLVIYIARNQGREEHLRSIFSSKKRLAGQMEAGMQGMPVQQSEQIWENEEMFTNEQMRRDESMSQSEPERGGRLFSVPLIVGMCICVVMIIWQLLR